MSTYGKTTNKIDPKRILLRNGALLIIPPMIISFGLWGALPAAYSPDIFWKDIPIWLGLFHWSQVKHINNLSRMSFGVIRVNFAA